MRNKLILAVPAVAAIALVSTGTVFAAPPLSTPLEQLVNDRGTALVVFTLALLVPLGLLLMAVGATKPDRAGDLAAIGIVTFVSGALAYLLVGFGVQFGGLGLVIPADWATLWVREWSPFDLSLGPGWGVVGLRYIPLLWKPQPAEVYGLAYLHAVAAGTAGMLPALALGARKRPLVAFLPALAVAALFYPLAGNWLWGGGWLANMGNTLELGHGFIDLAGAGPVHILGGAIGLALLLVLGLKEPPPPAAEPITVPPVHFPLFRLLGGILAFIGWLAWLLALPLRDPGTPVSLLAMNLLLAAAAGAMMAGLYTGFVTGKPDPMLALQGMVAALVAGSALAAFVHPWGALLTGAVAGLLICLGVYALERWLRLRDPTGTVITHLLGGTWGLLAVSLIANGRYGQGWQGTGVTEYLGLAGQGVTGALVGRGVQPDWPQQFYAQVIGVLALLILGYLLPAAALAGWRRLFVAVTEAPDQPATTPSVPDGAEPASQPTGPATPTTVSLAENSTGSRLQPGEEAPAEKVEAEEPSALDASAESPDVTPPEGPSLVAEILKRREEALTDEVDEEPEQSET